MDEDLLPIRRVAEMLGQHLRLPPLAQHPTPGEGIWDTE